MEFDFIDELPTVFNILKFNPGAVVDDTAIERLLSWLEEICSEKKPKLVEKSLEFLKCEEIWESSMTLSFSVRFMGYLGYHYADSNTEIVSVIKNMLLEIIKHKQFSEATVQYGFFKCLESLSKHKYWCLFLEEFLSSTLESFQNSYLYVKKAAVGFFASLIQILIHGESPRLCDVLKTIEFISDSEQLYQIVESVLIIGEIDINLLLKFLTMNNLIKLLTSNIRSNLDTDACCKLLRALQSIFSALTQPGSNVSWYSIISEDNPEEFLLDFVKYAKSRSEFKMLIPSFCRSLMVVDSSTCFSQQWNYKLLQFAISDISYHGILLKELEDEFLSDHQNISDTKLWKKLLIVVIGEMVFIEKKVDSDPWCKKLLFAWKKYCLMILTVSLSNDSERHEIDENLITVMYDKKVPRLCFQYLKEIGFKVFNKELNEEFLDCLWNCLFCVTDNPQIVCATLELLSRYISQNENNLTSLTQYASINIDKLINNISYSLADILNKLLWDTNWEVQDSLIDVLLKIIEKAKSGSKVSYNFLQENPFWVKVIDLINNQESYIRSKTICFIGAVVLYQPMWEMFSVKCNYSLLGLCKLLENIFTSEERQDDMFTRRSILQVFKSWISSKLEYIPFLLPYLEAKSNLKMEDVRVCLFKILENGSNDFDWEVRKLTFSTWTSMAIVASESCEQEVKDLYMNCIADNKFSLLLCNGICDCEYLVKMEAFKCLSYIKMNFLGLVKESTANEAEMKPSINNCYKIQSINEYEDLLKSFNHMDRTNFEHFLGKIDFEEIHDQLDILDVKVTTDPVSFIQDVIASAKQSDANLLDCY